MTQDVAFAKLEIGTDERFVSLRRKLGVAAFGMNLMRLEPGARGRIHAHAKQEEVYLVLEGVLSLVLEGTERDLTTGELARVPAERRRQLVNRGPEPCVILALGGAGEHVGRDGVAYASWESTRGAAPQEIALPEDLPPDQRRSSGAVKGATDG